MAAHTKGPWKGDLNVDDDQFAIYPDTGKMEFPIAIMPDFVKAEINTANARLIAAAPDLLEALKVITTEVEVFAALLHDQGTRDEIMANAAKARAAIARAAGEQP